MSERDKLVSGLKLAWRDEMGSARNYRALAEQESQTDRRDILLRLAEAEEKHAANWAARLRELGAEPGEYRETVVERARRWALLQSGTDRAVVKLEAAENGADAMYDELAKIAPSEEVRKQLTEAQQEERAHSRVLSEFTEGQVPPAQRRLERILRTEKWHVTGAGWIGQAIYGVNDGLGAAFGVVSGVAGATNVNGKFVLLSGIATAIASALSMGSGAYLATKSEREVYEAEIKRERMEIEQDPEQEREEMELFYQLKGFSPEEAKMMAARLAEQPEQLLKTLAHEELGVVGKGVSEPMEVGSERDVEHRGRSVRAGTSVFIFFGDAGPDLVVRHQHRGAFCSRRVEGDRDRPVVAKEWCRDDRGRRRRSAGDVRDRVVDRAGVAVGVTRLAAG